MALLEEFNMMVYCLSYVSIQSVVSKVRKTNMTCHSTYVNLVDQEKCKKLNSGLDLQGRTKFIWSTCLITSWYKTIWPAAKLSCKQFQYGHLVSIDNYQKVNEFKTVLTEVSF